MKRLLLILILTLSFQTLSKADDIRDFEIEGISIGDSLIKYYSKINLTTNTADYYKDNTYATQSFNAKKDSPYEVIQVSYIKKDKNFKAEAIGGEISFANDIDGCLKHMNNVKKDIASSLPSTIKEIENTNYNSSHGVYNYIHFIFDTGDLITISCYDYDNSKYTYEDTFKLNIQTKEYRKWINTKAYG